MTFSSGIVLSVAPASLTISSHAFRTNKQERPEAFLSLFLQRQARCTMLTGTKSGIDQSPKKLKPSTCIHVRACLSSSTLLRTHGPSTTLRRSSADTITNSITPCCTNRHVLANHPNLARSASHVHPSIRQGSELETIPAWLLISSSIPAKMAKDGLLSFRKCLLCLRSEPL